MAEFPALPLWTDAYLGDTRHLSQSEHGAYLLLLITAWRTPNCSPTAASIELNTGAPRGRAEIMIDPAGIVEVILGTMSAGQGHETSFAQVIGEWLGVAPDQVRLVTGDTDRAGLDHRLSRILRYRGEADVVAGNDHHEPLGGTI
jgi:hypothetical protein